jgi:putative PIN family toxin of toxin-antitoxin system
VIRAVVDPGVLIAGLIASRGVTADIIRAWQRGLFELVVSPLLLDELTETLLRPKFRRWLDENDAIAFVEVLRLAAVTVDDPAATDRVSRDPDDDYLIALARAAGAGVLVSGDADLTSLRGAEPPIVTPRQFLATIQAG